MKIGLTTTTRKSVQQSATFHQTHQERESLSLSDFDFDLLLVSTKKKKKRLNDVNFLLERAVAIKKTAL